MGIPFFFSRLFIPARDLGLLLSLKGWARIRRHPQDVKYSGGPPHKWVRFWVGEGRGRGRGWCEFGPNLPFVHAPSARSYDRGKGKEKTKTKYKEKSETTVDLRKQGLF